MFDINLKTKKSEKISDRITVEMTQWINACQMSLRTWVQILRVRAKVGSARLTCVIPELLHRDGKLLGQQACSTKQKATQRPCARQGGRWGPDSVSSSDLCEHTIEVKTKKTLTTNAVNHLSWRPALLHLICHCCLLKNYAKAATYEVISTFWGKRKWCQQQPALPIQFWARLSWVSWHPSLYWKQCVNRVRQNWYGSS